MNEREIEQARIRNPGAFDAAFDRVMKREAIMSDAAYLRRQADEAGKNGFAAEAMHLEARGFYDL